MNFETILFAAAFLLLGVMSISRNETPPVDPTSENSGAPTIAAPADETLLSTETKTETAKDGSTEAQVD